MAEKSAKKVSKTGSGRKAAPKKSAKGKIKTAPAQKTRKSSKAGGSVRYGKRFLGEMEKTLSLMRDRLIGDVARSGNRETDHPKFDVGDFYDKASDDRERILSLTFSERERNRLKQIEDALKRISEGSYGICEMTGEKIGEERLRAMPFARFSIEAQEDIEKVE